MSIVRDDKIDRFINSLAERREVRADDDVAPASTQSEAACQEPPTDCDAPLDPPSLAALFDLLLKDQPRLDRLAQQPGLPRELIPKFLAIGMLGYTIFGVGLALVFTSAGVWPELTPAAAWLKDPSGSSPVQFLTDDAAWTRWWDGSALALVAAFTLGLIGAIGVCLPSFYFYGLLAGVQSSLLQVTVHATKGMASSAIAVVGVLPIYVALVLGVLVLGAPPQAVEAQCFLGLLLPFIAGLWGTRSLYLSFVSLTGTMSPERRNRRAAFLRRLTLSWCGCFTAVTPLMIFTLWETMSRWI